MSLLSRIRQAFKFAMPAAPNGYDAAEDRGRRRPPRTVTSHEDSHANERRRRVLSGTTRDLARNWVLLAWAVRKHLDYVADVSFQAATDDPGFNREYEAWHKEASSKYRFDVAQRHSLRRATRLAEACKTIDGAVHWLKLAPAWPNPSRGAIQAIEDDRIAMDSRDMPDSAVPAEWVNGRRVDPKTGRVSHLGVCRRVGATRRELERVVSASNVFTHANFEFRFDQVGGVGPLAAALNFFQDTYEGFDYAFAKLKLGQLFGVTINRKSSETGFSMPELGDDESDDDESGEASDSSEPRIKLGQGPFVTELDIGEEAQIIESKNPSAETVAFLKLVILIVLRSLDIPYSFLDESHTNFFGSRGGMMQYLHACWNKILDLIEFLDEHHKWRVGLAVADGELVLPSGKEFEWLKWEYVPGGVPWWDQTKEVVGASMSIAAGFSSPRRVCREIGTNFRQNILETAEDIAFALSKGVPLNYSAASGFAPQIVTAAQAPATEAKP